MHLVIGAHQKSAVSHIFLDMDGVLCDMHKAIFALHNRIDLLEDLTHITPQAALGISWLEVWQPVVDAGWEFWDEIEPYPWAMDLWAWANDRAPVSICSRPLSLGNPEGLETGHCLRGKTRWLRRYFGNDFESVVFTAEKHLVSQPGVILIDDDERYEAEFNRRGGQQIVFPQPYNRFRHAAHIPMESVQDQFDLLRSS